MSAAILNDEWRMSNDERNPNDEFETWQTLQQSNLSFWLRHSFGIRHSPARRSRAKAGASSFLQC
jgi:hypothetical protein